LRVTLLERSRREVRLTSAGEALRDAARGLLSAWDEAAVSVVDLAAQDARVLRVGTLTSIGRSLYPGVIDEFARSMAGWRVELRSFSWSDPTAGLRERASDVAFLWLPIDAEDIEYEVLATENRVLAVSTRHPLAKLPSVLTADVLDEPFVALPESAGVLRDFWLASDRRGGKPANIAAEVASADETFEIVSSGAAVHLLAEGNAAIYARPGVTCVPVADLAPAQFAVGWRRVDRRAAVRSFVAACRETVRRHGAGSLSGTPVVEGSPAQTTAGAYSRQ
jgi:DNA-binding transcriptional LysR family regulator